MIAFAAFNGEDRSTAGAEQVAEGCDNDDDRETEPYSAEGRGANVRDTGNIDTVNDIVAVSESRGDHQK